jgi:glycosyltransferase involved in cell wall biosynthesis
VITSPIGAGAIIRNGVEGSIVDPHDRAALVSALRRLADDVALRRSMGAAARLRAADYTWEKLAERRYGLIRSAMRGAAASPSR